MASRIMIVVGIIWLIWGATHPRTAGAWIALGVVFLALGARRLKQSRPTDPPPPTP